MTNDDSPTLAAFRELCQELYDEYLTSGSLELIDSFLPGMHPVERRMLTNDLVARAAISNDLVLLNAMVERGFELRPAESSSLGPISFAMHCAGDCAEIVAWMLDHGAEVDCRAAAYGRSTPLMEAVAAGHLETVALLLERGADPNATTEIDDNESPLFFAVNARDRDAVWLLLTQRADMRATNRSGMSIEELAEKNGLTDIFERWRKRRR